MVDFKKLDSFFDLKNLKEQIRESQTATGKRARVIRMVKLLLPAFAAALIGLLAIMPSLQDRSNDLKIRLEKPSLQDIEKLHMENTIFYLTDKNNQVSNFTAENIDEVSENSEMIKLSKPKGNLAAGSDNFIDIIAPLGYYNQTSKILSLQENVTMTSTDGIVAKSDEVLFDGNQAKVYSIMPVTAEGYFGKLDAEGFEYFNNSQIMAFTGKGNIDIIQSSSSQKLAEPINIKANDRIEIYQKENKAIAIGQAIVTKANMKINGDKLTAFFAKLNNKGSTQIVDFLSEGNVKINTGKAIGSGDKMQYNLKQDQMKLFGKPAKINSEKNTITADNNITYYMSQEKAIATGNVVADNGINQVYSDIMEIFFSSSKDGQTALERVEVPKNVRIVTKQGNIKAKTGVYYPKTGIVKLFDDVEIVQNGNILRGERAETNLNTGISKILSSKANRVTGTLWEENLKSDK